MKETRQPKRQYEPLPESLRFGRVKVQGILIASSVAALGGAVHYAIAENWRAAGFFVFVAVVAAAVALWLVPLMTRRLDEP